MQRILQYTGLISSYIVFCGVLKFYIYYKSFGISILQFVELQEIIILFMDNLIAYLAIILPTTLTLFFLFYNKYTFNSWRSKELRKTLITLILFCILCFVGGYIYYKNNRGLVAIDFILLIILIVICILAIPLAYPWVYRFLNNKIKIKINLPGITSIFLAIILLLYTISTAINEVFKVKNQKYYSGVEIRMKENKVITSDDSCTFIGNTKNYVFLYYNNSMSCVAYKMSDIESIKFPIVHPSTTRRNSK